MKKAELKKLDNQSLRNKYENCKRNAINVINDGFISPAIDCLQIAVKIEQILYERGITLYGEKV